MVVSVGSDFYIHSCTEYITHIQLLSFPLLPSPSREQPRFV
jgi:hypothetical protein